MLGSENHFFTQSIDVLKEKRNEAAELLEIKGYKDKSIDIYLKAYDYFTVNPSDFDGATLVKDLCDIPDLDLDAMLHDWMYVVYNVASNVIMKWRADKLYAKGNERKGKSPVSAWSRFIGLTLVTIGFTPFARIERGKMTLEQKTNFMLDYHTLMLNL